MKSIKEVATSQNAKEIASWTQASLFTVGKSLRSAGSSVCAGLKTGYDHLASEPTHREQVAFLKFGSLEGRRGLGMGAECSSCPALLLGLDTGFQIWTLGDSVKEVVSRRDGPASCLEALPLPSEEDMPRCAFLEDWPLVAVASDATAKQGEADGPGGVPPPQGLPVSTVRLYSLRRHSYIHTLTLPGRVLGLCCSRRVLLVAMVSQIMAYDTATMTVTYSAITQPAPVLRPGGQPEPGAVPLALGPRWLAHASNQAVQSASGVAVGQRIGSGSWGVGGPQGGASNMDAVQHYAGLAAKSSGKHMKNLGEAGYKYLSSQVENWRGGGSHPPSSPSSSTTPTQEDLEVEGTVIVRNMVSRSTLAHFRAHTSPLLLLRFDASGTLLVTASVHGHTINVFHLSSPAAGGGGAGSALHLFRLSRGMTSAVIQDVGFSCSGEWLCVSSARGTTHVFRLSLPGKEEGAPPHLVAAAMPAAARREFRPVKLVAAGRARGAAGMLNGSIPGSAAASAAVNLYNGSAGASLVAATFVPRHPDAASSQVIAPPPPAPRMGMQEDLMVITQEGALTRYRLHAPPPPNHAGPGVANVVTNGKTAEERGGELVVEAVEQFEVCRKQSWPEREDSVFPTREGNGEEVEGGQPLPWATHAEACLPYSGVPLPRIWADSQFQFLEMQDGQITTGDSADNLASSMLLVEEMPTKRVSLQSRGGLAPVKLEGAETAVLRGAHFTPQGRQRSDPVP